MVATLIADFIVVAVSLVTALIVVLMAFIKVYHSSELKYSRRWYYLPET